jgi:uncharacterized protein
LLQDILFINKGGIAEQVVGQILRANPQKYIDPQLYYYVREAKGSEAEIDYVIQKQMDIIPIEVKAGATGSMKSLHQFIAQRKLPVAVRINAGLPSVTDIDVKTTTGIQSQYTLLSLPFYLISELDRLIRS